MKKCFLIPLIFFISACNLLGVNGMSEALTPGETYSPCGDGVCSVPENTQKFQAG